MLVSSTERTFLLEPFHNFFFIKQVASFKTLGVAHGWHVRLVFNESSDQFLVFVEGAFKDIFRLVVDLIDGHHDARIDTAVRGQVRAWEAVHVLHRVQQTLRKHGHLAFVDSIDDRAASKFFTEHRLKCTLDHVDELVATRMHSRSEYGAWVQVNQGIGYAKVFQRGELSYCHLASGTSRTLRHRFLLGQVKYEIRGMLECGSLFLGCKNILAEYQASRATD